LLKDLLYYDGDTYPVCKDWEKVDDNDKPIYFEDPFIKVISCKYYKEK